MEKLTYEKKLWIFIILLNIIDVELTYIGISFFGLTEQNLFTQYVWHNKLYGNVLMFVFVGLTSLYGLWILFNKSKILLGIFIMSFVYVIIGNIFMIIGFI